VLVFVLACNEGRCDACLVHVGLVLHNTSADVNRGLQGLPHAKLSLHAWWIGHSPTCLVHLQLRS
jgi:hypothetical protein